MYGDGFTWRSTRYTSKGSIGLLEVEALREDDLEDVAGEDVLAGDVHRVVVAGTAHRGPHRGNLGERVGGRRRRHVRQRPGEVVDQPGETVHGPVVGAVDVGLGVEEHVLDQVETLAEVVERGDVPGEGQHRVGEPQVVGRDVGEPLDFAHDVVAEVADHAAVERRQLVEAGRPVHAEERLQRRERALVEGHAGRRGAAVDARRWTRGRPG